MRRLALNNGKWSEGADGDAVWIRAGGASADELAELAAEFGLHPLTLEDVQHTRQRPKVEDYEETTFIVARIPRGRDPDKGWQQVGIWLLPNRVITASPSPLAELDAVEQRLARKSPPMTAGMVCYHILDTLVDSWFPFMETLEEDVERAEDAAMDSPSQATLREIRDVKHTVSRIRKLMSPMRESMVSLERGEHPNITDDLRLYLRDVSDHTIRLSERLDHVREVALIAQETWNSTLANQQNTVMKRLTVVAALLLFPGLMAGLGGMNFEGFPAWDYWTVTISLLAFVAIGAGLAIWRRWL